MISDLRASLYDLFGYFIPGVTATCGLALLAHRFVNIPQEIGAATSAPIANGIPLVLVAYILGHAMHGIGNIIPGLNRTPESHAFSERGLPQVLLTRVRDLLTKQLTADVANLPPEELYALADEASAARGSAGDRDVYIYREGFYRGMVVALAILALGLATSATASNHCVVGAPAAITCIPRGLAIFSTFLALGISWLFFHRMRRFGRYRVQRGMYRYLMTSHS